MLQKAVTSEIPQRSVQWFVSFSVLVEDLEKKPVNEDTKLRHSRKLLKLVKT